MSLADLRPTIHALPRAERVRLLHLLIDDVARPEPDGGVPENLRAALPAPGAARVWLPEANPEAVAAAQRALQDENARV